MIIDIIRHQAALICLQTQGSHQPSDALSAQTTL